MFKLLIVEDEEMIRKGLRYTFDWTESDIIVVDEACDGEEGLAKIEALKPDIVLLDINMPIMDGLTMLKNSINDFNYSAIIISGYDEFNLAKEAIHLGVTEYLLKPLDNENLVKALEKAKKQVSILRNQNIIVNSPSEYDELSIMQKKILKNVSSTSYYVNEMLKYVHSTYNKKITIQSLVDTLGVSSTYLNKQFKEETSYTFNDYLNRYRIRQAIKILKDNDAKIYNVAAEVGFKEYRYFINVFKKYTGCVPSDFVDFFDKSH